MSAWIGGFADWTEGSNAYLSLAFTWMLDTAYSRALWYRALGYKVHAGGPGLFFQRVRQELEAVAEIGGDCPDAISHHNPQATFASRGCPVGCHFCIVPQMEGKQFTLLPEFPVRPVLCDNNLSALPEDYQKFIIGRYKAEGIPLLDANSGFEPSTFDEAVYRRWSEINRGPWRFAFDEQRESAAVERVMTMLKCEPQKRKRVYVLIGNEPFESCMDRIHRVIAWGGDPHVQPYIKLNITKKRPHVQFDWTSQKLRDVARWTNGWVWKKAPFSEYQRSLKSRPQITHDTRQTVLL